MQQRQAPGASLPLSREVKASCVQALAKENPKNLNVALIHLALDPTGYDFPPTVKKKLGTLQLALTQNSQNSKIRSLLESAVTEYMQSEGNELFAQLIKDPINEAHWHSDFLQSLANILRIPINLPPFVQATIQAGKIYWRLVQNNTVIYDRHHGRNAGIVFTPENSWLTDWRQFRAFKDSGKRFSTIRITKQRYIDSFDNANHHVFAGLAWEELKQIGILNTKDRISHGWRALFSHNVKLNAVEAVKLKTKKITDANKVKLYDLVITQLEKVANDPRHTERVDLVNGYTIFRNERTHKKWSGTGNVTYAQPKSAENCNKIWDVSVYQELVQHRASDEETKLYGEILNYDHIPAKSALKNTPSPAKNAHDGVVNVLKTERSNIIAQREHDTGHVTRGTPAALAKSHQDEIVITAKLTTLNDEFTEEAEKWSFTVAIPEKLHHAGETFLASASAQKKFTGHVFARDIAAHIHNILESPEKYALKILTIRYVRSAQCAICIMLNANHQRRSSAGIFI